MRSGPHERHVSFEHVQELRELVEMSGPEGSLPTAVSRGSRRVACRYRPFPSTSELSATIERNL